MTESLANRPIEHLVLVDDDEVDQILHQRIIERSNLVEHVHSFRMARDALDYFDKGGEADLVLLDIRMPGMTGFEFLDAAMARLGPEFAPVVMMLTTSMDPRDRAVADSYPMVKGYLEKPLDEAAVRQLAEMVTSMRGPTQPDTSDP